jgi:hypothetical protein
MPRALCVSCVAVSLVGAMLVLAYFGQPVAAAGPAAIGIDFVGNGTPMASSEIGGVVARSRWNAASGANRTTPLALVDESGTVTGASVTWTSDATEATGINDQAGNFRLMKGYVESRGTRTVRVVVTGLAAATYDVYVYVDGANSSSRRTATYRISGTGITTTSTAVTDAAYTNFAGSFTRAQNSVGNYARFTVTASAFTITATPGSSSNYYMRAPVNAIQIVPVAPAVTYRISGVISPIAAGAAATVSLGGSAIATTVADASGAFSFTGLANGSYVVMPARAGYTFTPSSRSVTIASADVGAVTFNGFPTPPTYAIRGAISPASGVSGTTLSLSGSLSATTTAGSDGTYAFTAVPDGTYSVTAAKAGWVFTPATRSVTVSGAAVSAVDFTASGPTMARANSYDDGWQHAWVSHGRALLGTPGKTAGFVLQIGDSITHSRAYSAWAIGGQGRTADDQQVMTWARANLWSGTNTDVANKNGWYLAGADTTPYRGLTSSGGMSTAEFVTGCCNSGPAMPIETSPAAARQFLANTTYTGNLQVDTVVAAFSDAQFAVVMLGTNDPGSPTGLLDLATIVDTLEAAGIFPILSTIPPRSDASSNQFTLDFNAGVRALAQSRSLPLIDFYKEITLRRPGTTWMNTLISSDGVHPTGDRQGFTVASNPYAAGGDPGTHTTGDAAANVGYLLRSWLTVQKLKEVKRHVVDGVDPF